MNSNQKKILNHNLTYTAKFDYAAMYIDWKLLSGGFWETLRDQDHVTLICEMEPTLKN